MPKRTYRVEHQGKTHTRKTDRTYTHVVLVRRDYETELANQIRIAREFSVSTHAYAVEKANQPIDRRSWMTADELAEQARVAALTLEQYQAECVERVSARVKERRAKGEFDTLGPLTWCGRPDLAANEERKARANGYWAEVVVLPVPQPD